MVSVYSIDFPSNSRIADNTPSWEGVCDADIIDWPTADPFLLAISVLCTAAHGNCSSEVKLQFQRDGGAWVDVGDAGAGEQMDAIAGLNDPGDGGCQVHADTVLVGTPPDVQEAISATTYEQFTFSLDPGNAKGGSQYTFRLWDTGDGSAVPGTAQAQITILQVDASQNLAAAFVVRQAGSEDLPAEFVASVGEAADEDLLAEFKVARTGTPQELLGGFTVRQWYADFASKFRVTCPRRMGSNWQRKMWYQAGRFWRGRYDPIGEELIFEWIAETGLAANVWAKNANASIDASTFSGPFGDFAIRGSLIHEAPGGPTTIIYSDGVDTWVAESDDATETGWAWENTTKVFDATAPDTYTSPMISSDKQAAPKLWATAIFYDQSSGKRWIKGKRETVSNDITAWDAAVDISNINNTDTIYGQLNRALGPVPGDDLIVVWKEGDALKSRYFDGDWDAAIQDIDLTVARASWDFEHHQMAGGNFEGHLIYIDADGSVQWKERPAGAAAAWGAAVQVEAYHGADHTKGCGIVEHGSGLLWVIWVNETNSTIEYRLHDCADASWYPALHQDSLIFSTVTDAVIATDSISQLQSSDDQPAGSPIPVTWIGQTGGTTPCNPGWGILMQPTRRNLHAGFRVAQESLDLAASFDAQVSLNLASEFIVRQAGSAELLGEGVVRHYAIKELSAYFDVQVSLNLPAELTVRQPGSQDLPAEFDIRRSSLEELPAKFISRQPGSEDLFAGFFVPLQLPMEQVLFGGYDNLLDDTDTEYNSLIGGYTWFLGEDWRHALISTDGYIKQLRVKLDGSPGIGKKYTFTLMLNENPTALTFDIAGEDIAGGDMVNQIDVTGSDTVTIRSVPDGDPTPRLAAWTCVFEGDVAKESLILGGSDETLNNGAIEYGQVMCSRTNYSITENNFRQVVPTAGTIKKFYVKLSTDPGTAPDAYRFTVRLNGATVAQSLIVTITANAVTGSDLVHNLVVAADDILTMMIEPLNAPSATPRACWGMTFLADVDGESIVLGGSSNDLNAAVIEYYTLTGWEANFWTATETNRYQLGQVCTLKKLYILLSAAPGAGKKYDFTIRIAGAASNVVATVDEGNTTGNSGALKDTVALDEYVDLESDPDGGPDVADAYWGFVCIVMTPDSAELPGEFISRQPGSQELPAEFIVRQPGSQELLGEFISRQAGSQDLSAEFAVYFSGFAELPAEFVSRQPGSQELLGEFIVRQAGSQDLAASFDGQVSLNLPAEFISRQAGSQELLGEFISRQAGSQELPAEFIVRQPGSQDLLGELVIRRSASQELLGEFVTRRDGSQELLGEFIVRRAGSQELPAEFEVQAEIFASQELPAEFVSRQTGSQELLAEFVISLTSDSQELLAEFDVRRPASEELLGEFIARQPDSQELLGKFISRQLDSQELSAEFIVRQPGSQELSAEFWVAVVYSQELSGEFISRQAGSQELAASFDGQVSLNLPAELTVRQPGSQELLGEFDIRRDDSEELLGKFDVQRSASQELLGEFISRQAGSQELGASFDAQVSLDLPAEFTVRRDGDQELLGELVVRQPGSQELLGEFTIRRDGSKDLGASFDAQVSLNLPAEFISRQADSEELLGKFNVRRDGSQELFSEFEVRRDGSQELLAEFDIRRSSLEELPAKFISRQPGSEDLLGELSIRRSASEELAGEFVVRRSASQDLLGELIVRQAGSQDLGASFDGQVSLNLSAGFTVRQAASQDLKMGFWVRYYAESLLAKIYIRPRSSKAEGLVIVDIRRGLTIHDADRTMTVTPRRKMRVK